MSNTANRVIKNTGFLYMKMAITMFISLLTTRIILNSLGASDFGIFNIIGGAITALGFLNSTMASATQRFLNYAEGESDLQKKTIIFNVSLVLHFAVAVIFGLMLVVAALFFFNGILNIPDDRIFAAKIVYASLVISTVFTVMTVPYDAVMNSHENMKYYAIIGVLECLLKLAVAIATIFSPIDKLVLFGYLMASIPIVLLTIMRFFCHRHYAECKVSFRYYCEKKTFADITKFAGWNFMGSTSSLVGNYGLGIVLNHFFGELLNAAHGIAFQLNNMLMVFSRNMQKALNPVIAKCEGAGERERMIRLSITGNKISFCIFSFFALPAIVEMPFLLKLWLNTVPDYAIVFSQLVLTRTLVEQTTIFFNTAIGAEGHISNFNKITAITNLIPLVVSYALFKINFPPESMYIVNLFVFGFINCCVKVYFMVRNCGMHINKYLNSFIIPVFLMLIICIPIMYTPLLMFHEGILRLLLTFIISSIILLISCASIVLDAHERLLIKTIIKEKVSILNKKR